MRVLANLWIWKLPGANWKTLIKRMNSRTPLLTKCIIWQINEFRNSWFWIGNLVSGWMWTHCNGSLKIGNSFQYNKQYKNLSRAQSLIGHSSLYAMFTYDHLSLRAAASAGVLVVIWSTAWTVVWSSSHMAL